MSLLILFTLIVMKTLDFNDSLRIKPCDQKQRPGKLEQKPFTKNENKKQKHLYFLRTHKCGSTTIYSLFLRFGYRNNLTFVLPTHPTSATISRWPFQIGVGYYRIPKGEKYEILCHHTTYHRKNLKKVLPKDTMYIGLVREPFSHFVSSFIYYTNVHKLPDLHMILRNDTASSISWYLGNQAYIDKNHTRKGRVDWTHMRNGMAYDFGFPINDIRNASWVKIDQFVKKLDIEFDLVIVLEHLDESLVLMKRMLRWSMKDILYILQSNKGVINSSNVKNSLTDIDRQRHREWEPIDIALYNHFLIKLLKRVNKEGASFQEELEDFKLAKHAAMQFCEDKKINEELKWTIESTNEEITINSYDCTMLETIGGMFTPLIKQSKKYS